MLADKLELWWFHAMKLKINRNHLVSRLGPRAEADAGGRGVRAERSPECTPEGLGTRWLPMYFIFHFSKTTKISICLPTFL